MTPEGQHKRGRLNKEEKAYIKANASLYPAAEIGKKLNRHTSLIEQFIKNEVNARETKPFDLAPAEAEKVVITQDLKATETWKRLKDEFSEDELKYFQERYVALVSQFKGDVVATEETQIFQLVKFELLMSRNLMGRREAQDDIARLEATQEAYFEKFGGNPANMTEEERVYSINLDTEIRQARSEEASRTTEYVKLQERHDSLMKTLKGTRDQRFDKIEREGVDFIGVIKQLNQRDVQEREGRQLELMKLAAKKELERLGRPHKFDDGNEDSAILCVDTVDLGPEETEVSEDEKAED